MLQAMKSAIAAGHNGQVIWKNMFGQRWRVGAPCHPTTSLGTLCIQYFLYQSLRKTEKMQTQLYTDVVCTVGFMRDFSIYRAVSITLKEDVLRREVKKSV